MSSSGPMGSPESIGAPESLGPPESLSPAGTAEVEPLSAPLPDEREWVSLDHDGDTYLFDLTFLRSNWTCIFGSGCKGIHEHDAAELNEGCCTVGAHFSDRDDRKRVLAAAAELTDEQWQLRSEASSLGGPVVKVEKKVWTTRVHDGACVFLNRNDFHRGPGCALHLGALDNNESFLEWKPEVCWQVPLRLSHHVDDSAHTTWTLTDWKRRDWGEGGSDFHWWCTEGTDAFVGSTSVAESLAGEITSLVGAEVYERLMQHLRRSDESPVASPRRRS